MMIAVFFCGCIIAGLFTTPFFRVLPSIGMVGTLITGLLCYGLHRASYQRAPWTIYGSFVLVFGIHLASGLVTSTANWSAYERDVVLQLPFLSLPFAFWLLPPLPTRYLQLLWLWLLGLTLLGSLVSTGNYLLHTQEINESYLRSKVMPTEPDHIRFSLIVTLAVVAGSLLLMHHNVGPRLRPWVLGAVIWLALYQHMLAVRSGLLTLYVLGGITCLWLLIRHRDYLRALQVAAVMLVLPIVSYICFPTFQNKYANTREDVGRVEHTESANNYSLVGRVYSYRVAAMVIKENFLLGVGKADMEQEMAAHYQKEFPNIRQEAYILPHNQYLYSAVAFGIIGVLLFIIGFYYAGISIWPRYAPLLAAHYLIVTLSFLVEYTLETQVGVAFSLFFLLLALEGSKPVSQPEAEWRPA
ncbi:O-antigen ligase family protein [Hymenobacter mucosus]|uniref:O-antigen ligase n=1 Tax=Hymenobacter mucosus TaxID=1411120 RepID=A0A238WGK7_9BACT|nr:O-antigen ligase family protein [Hymenobacter mucosus]SNR45354.1 O-antigen ligase [Hymenobacter mucosus]